MVASKMPVNVWHWWRIVSKNSVGESSWVDERAAASTKWYSELICSNASDESDSRIERAFSRALRSVVITELA